MDKLSRFLKRILNENCQCFDKECKVSEIPPKVSKVLHDVAKSVSEKVINPTCFQIFSTETIVPDSMDETDFDNVVWDYLNFFVEIDLLKQNADGLFVFNSGDTVKWSTIMLWDQHNSDRFIPTSIIKKLMKEFDLNVDEAFGMVKLLFWFLRKGIVDNLLKKITVSFAEGSDCIAMSVGSTRVTSDYDVTVYGSCSGFVASRFTDEIMDLFGKHSSDVFDCNIYGASFIEVQHISKDRAAFYLDATCNGRTFWYLKEEEETISDQHIWALMKLNSAMMRHGITIAANATWMSVQKLYNDLNLIEVDYEQLIVYGLNMQNPIAKMSPIRNYTNMISAINFKGQETYFTRGAFLDVVVNTQMCGGVGNVALSFDAKLDSLVENLADKIEHPAKLKYTTRVHSVVNQMFAPKWSDCVKQKQCMTREVADRFIENLENEQYEQCINIVLSYLLPKITPKSLVAFQNVVEFLRKGPKKRTFEKRLRRNALHPLAESMGSLFSFGSKKRLPTGIKAPDVSMDTLIGGGNIKQKFSYPRIVRR